MSRRKNRGNNSKARNNAKQANSQASKSPKAKEKTNNGIGIKAESSQYECPSDCTLSIIADVRKSFNRDRHHSVILLYKGEDGRVAKKFVFDKLRQLDDSGKEQIVDLYNINEVRTSDLVECKFEEVFVPNNEDPSNPLVKTLCTHFKIVGSTKQMLDSLEERALEETPAAAGLDRAQLAALIMVGSELSAHELMNIKVTELPGFISRIVQHRRDPLFILDKEPVMNYLPESEVPKHLLERNAQPEAPAEKKVSETTEDQSPAAPSTTEEAPAETPAEEAPEEPTTDEKQDGAEPSTEVKEEEKVEEEAPVTETTDAAKAANTETKEAKENAPANKAESVNS